MGGSKEEQYTIHTLQGIRSAAILLLMISHSNLIQNRNRANAGKGIKYMDDKTGKKMYIRKLHKTDAKFMLEWMRDENVTAGLKKKFYLKTLEDCIEFIENSYKDDNCLHLAVADEGDIYMGTVSLKNIDKEKYCAEFAIAMRSCAMGKGFSEYGMREIFNIGWEELGLNMIYWNVLKMNRRAVRFYEKMCLGRRSADFEISRGGGVYGRTRGIPHLVCRISGKKDITTDCYLNPAIHMIWFHTGRCSHES